MEILITVEEFLKNDGILNLDRILYKTDGKILGYFLNKNNNKIINYYNLKIDKASIETSKIMVKIKVKPIYQ